MTDKITYAEATVISVLLITFFSLKLLGVLEWPWCLVILVPFVIDFALCVAAVFILIAYVAVAMALGVHR